MPKSRRPTSKSYLNVKESVQDPFVMAKLHFFSFVANIVGPFFKRYQKYFYFDRKSLVMKLLELVIKPMAIDACKAGKQLTEFNLIKRR